MQKTTFIILFTTMTIFGFSQDAVQTIVIINERLRKFADANNIVYVDYHSALADEHGAFPAKLSADGCHPNPDTYFVMEEFVLKAIGEALR